MRITPTPADSAVFVDGLYVPPDPGPEGRPDPSGTRTIPYRYYGQMSVSTLPRSDQERTAQGAPVLADRQLVSIPTPAPRWLFPLDFFVELAQLPVTGFGDVEVAVELSPDPGAVVPGDVPEDHDALQSRALQSRGAR